MSGGSRSTSSRRWSLTLLLMGTALVLLVLLDIALGSVYIPLKSLVSYVFQGETGNDSWDLIISNFRAPKATTAVLVGASLAVSGLQMQTLFRNPLAGPFVLGISSGAGLGVALLLFSGVYLGWSIDLLGVGRNWTLVFAAAAGSLLVLLIVLLASVRVRDAVSLLIVGLMFGTVSSAVVSILQFFSKAERIQAYVIWGFGSLGGVAGQELFVLATLSIIGLSAAVLLSKTLNALLLGEEYAASMGLNLRKARLLIIINTSILAGAATAFCGPIAFIGLAVPHLARMLFNTSNHLLLTPIVILFGGCLMLTFDIISQVPGSDMILPLNAITSLFGAPFVIWVLLRKRTLNYSFR